MLYTVVVSADDYKKEDLEALVDVGGYKVDNVYVRRHLLDKGRLVVNMEVTEGDPLDIIVKLKDFFKVEKVNLYNKKKV